MTLLFSKKDQSIDGYQIWKPKLRLGIRCGPLSKHPLPPARHLPHLTIASIRHNCVWHDQTSSTRYCACNFMEGIAQHDIRLILQHYIYDINVLHWINSMKYCLATILVTLRRKANQNTSIIVYFMQIHKS